MPISTSTVKTVITEKKISKIIIDDDNRIINIDLVYRDKYDDGHVINERRHIVSFSGAQMLEIAGIDPRTEVPSGLSYYEAIRDWVYQYLTEKNLWPE